MKTNIHLKIKKWIFTKTKSGNICIKRIEPFNKFILSYGDGKSQKKDMNTIPKIIILL